MSRGANPFVLDLVATVNNLFNFPETMEKFMFLSGEESRRVSSIPVDILDTPNQYVFYVDVPGLSKSEIQVKVEEVITLDVRSNGKRKCEAEDEGCKYLRLERRTPQKLLSKFSLPENANVSAIMAKYETGVLTLAVEKHPPPPESRFLK